MLSTAAIASVTLQYVAWIGAGAAGLAALSALVSFILLIRENAGAKQASAHRDLFRAGALMAVIAFALASVCVRLAVAF